MSLKLSQNRKNDNIETIPDSLETSEISAQKSGRCIFWCDDAGDCEYPAVSYEPAIASDGEARISKAFAILFHEVMRARKSKNPP